MTTLKTYDIQFSDSTEANNKGFKFTLKDAENWIKNNLNTSYFSDYKGGTVSIICNETGEYEVEYDIDFLISKAI